MSGTIVHEKSYLGDGVYVVMDRGMFKLTTENGVEVSNEIFLESEVIVNLLKYLKEKGVDLTKV